MKKVLVIDDDPAIARLVGVALEKRKLEHSLEYCSDGGQGRLKATGGEYDLIVLDLAMPFMDGVTALAEMKRNPKSAAVPVVVVTALTDPILLQQVRDLGAATVISKPFEHWELADAVRLVLAGDALKPEPGPATGPAPDGGARPAT